MRAVLALCAGAVSSGLGFRCWGVRKAIKNPLAGVGDTWLIDQLEVYFLGFAFANAIISSCV